MSKSVPELMNSIHKLHFVGIGGSGMFPLVEILLGEGYAITGSDLNESSIVKRERELGVTVYIGHRADQVGDAEALVVTAALLDGNPELEYAKAHGIPVIERAALLGYVTSRYPKAICISGTHGKTTATSMLTAVLYTAGMDPSAVIGGKLPLIGGYGRSGKTDWMVCEACEFKDTFLETDPYYAVILNIDADHLDYFGSVDRLKESFRTFATMARKAVIANGDDERTMSAIRGIPIPVITFGTAPTCDYVLSDIECYERAYHRFRLSTAGAEIGQFTLVVPGRHNVYNAAAAVVCALLEGVSPDVIQEALGLFRGAGRRFEILGVFDGVTIADDYAHHPAELEVTLDAAQQMGYNKVIAVFQPFTFTRTKMLLDEFAAALSRADAVVLTEIMGSREVNSYNITTQDLVDKIDGAVWFDTFEKVCRHCLSIVSPGDLIITLGCGDIYKAANRMVELCQQ